MAVWKDATEYTQREKTKQRIPRAWELVDAPHRIYLHRHVMSPDTWFVTCYPIGISGFPTNEAETCAAQNKALDIVLRKICDQITELQDLYVFVKNAKGENY